MRMLRIGLAQLDPTVGDLDGNTDRILAAIADARARGVELLVFPEMMLTGYPPEDLLLKPGFLARVAECDLVIEVVLERKKHEEEMSVAKE